MSMHQFLWLDLETTGLDPHSCQILEWAAVLAADDVGGDMSPISEYTGVVHFDYSSPPKMDAYVRAMHTKNGLLSECIASDTSLEDGEEFLLDLARDLAGPDPKGIVLAGSTVHFDLGFIRVHMPRFAKCLSHRVFDVSTLKLADQAWTHEGVFKKAEAHRALPDILESLAQAAEIRLGIERWNT